MSSQLVANRVHIYKLHLVPRRVSLDRFCEGLFSRVSKEGVAFKPVVFSGGERGSALLFASKSTLASRQKDWIRALSLTSSLKQSVSSRTDSLRFLRSSLEVGQRRSTFTAMAKKNSLLLESLGWTNVQKRLPASVGQKEIEIETPALVVDLDIVDRNIEKLNELLRPYPNVKARLHAKAHKAPGVAILQVERHEAVGVCCQKLTEAEAMVAGGVSDVLISNEIVSRSKLERLALLAKHATISVCADSIENVRDISSAAEKQGASIGVLVEVNVGQNRCGVETAEEAVALAKEISRLPSINFKGIQAYHGGIQHVRSKKERQKAVEEVALKAKKVVHALKEAGLDCPVVTGGGTGTFEFEATSGVYTEVQPGSYIFGDADYSRNEDSPWEQSLFIQATVMSVNPSRKTAVIDAGLKASSFDSGPPLLTGHLGESFEVKNGGDEHGVLKPKGGKEVELPKVGEIVRLIPGHCDPTVNCHDFLIGVRDGHVETVWEVSGRGPGF